MKILGEDKKQNPEFAYISKSEERSRGNFCKKKFWRKASSDEMGERPFNKQISRLPFYDLYELKMDQKKLDLLFKKSGHLGGRMIENEDDQVILWLFNWKRSESESESIETSLQIKAKLVESEIISNKIQQSVDKQEPDATHLLLEQIPLKNNKRVRILKKRKRNNFESLRQRKFLKNMQIHFSTKFSNLEKKCKKTVDKNFLNRPGDFIRIQTKMSCKKDVICSKIDNLGFFSDYKSGEMYFFKKENLDKWITRALVEHYKHEEDNLHFEYMKRPIQGRKNIKNLNF